MHDQLQDSPQEIDRQLAAAKRALQEFEDGVDRKRLILRLRTASPAHPVLLFRFLFGGLGLLFALAAVAVLAAAQINSEVARAVAKFEMVSPLPEEIPLLPTLLGSLAAAMLFARLMATFAAWALGRDAPLLAWEQKRHQQLVNEVTRLGTQKAVVERIRNTPAGARPRIATPVPSGMRRTGPVSPPTGAAFNRAGLGTPSHSPAQARSFGPQSVPGYTGSAPSAPPSQPRVARQGVVSPAPSASPAAASSAPPGSAATAGLSRTPSATPAPRPSGATPAGARPRDRGGLGGLSAPSGASGPAPATGIRFGQVGADPTPVRSESAPTEPMVRPAHSLRPRDAAPLPARDPSPPRPASTGAPASGGGVRAPIPTPVAPAARTPLPSPLRAPEPDRAPVPAPLAATPAPSSTPRPAADRPAIVLPPLDAAGPVRAAPAAADDAPVDRDEVANGSNGAPNRAHDGRIAGIDPDTGDGLGGRGAAAADGILGQAQVGTNVSRPTPYGSAGRVRLPATATLQVGNGPVPMGQSTRGGTPLGAPPKAGIPVGQAAPRLAALVPRPMAPLDGTPDPTDGRDVAGPVVDLADMPEIFATPAGPRVEAEVVIDDLTEDEDTGTIEFDVEPAQEGLVVVEESDEVPYAAGGVEDDPDGDEGDDLQDDMPTILPTSPSPATTPPMPTGAGSNAPWLTEALGRADALARSLPPQAALQLSREPHLPFTLVITRATPALAVRAMVSFVEFLAGIATPPRARIELVGVAHLDRSFYKNVVAALEPYFGGNSEVVPSAGQVDIRFTDPDPGWSDHPRLPA